MGIKVVRAEDAVGSVLAYDITYVTKDFMRVPLRRGDVVREEHVKLLKQSGHYYVFVYDSPEEESGIIYEDRAVLKLAELVSGEGTAIYGRRGGKAIIRSTLNGVLLIDGEGLRLINSGGEFALVTREPGIGVSVGDILAVVDLIPFYISEKSLNSISKRLGGRKVIYVKPFKPLSFGVIVTGTEIYEGRVKDMASPVVENKVSKYGGRVAFKEILPDDKEMIRERLTDMLRRYDGVILTGGMSVDPTDVTHEVIREVSDEVIAYGIPVKPTTMSMIAYCGGKPIIGVSSGIVFFRDWNVLDIILPRVMAGVKWGREEIIDLALGGLHDVYLRRLEI